MEQIYNMSAENVRQFAYEYLRCGVTSRAIQCLERLKWLGKLRQHEYLLLSTIYSTNTSLKLRWRLLRGTILFTYKKINLWEKDVLVA